MLLSVLLVLESALWKKDVGRRLRFPELLAQREANGGVLGKRPRRSPVKGRGGLSGRLPNPKFPLGRASAIF